MEIIKATIQDKENALILLDNFRTICFKIQNPGQSNLSNTATKKWWKLFDEVINSSLWAIFLAKDDNKYIGIVTVYKIPQIRKWVYCAEIEELFVDENFHGKWVALLLINNVIEWAKNNDINNIRLETSSELKRAHKFYEKVGFKLYGQAYIKDLN